jgi:molecular chaperone DnaJ
MSDYYDILGINRKASLAEIKKAYQKMARKFHPDLNPGDNEAEKRFKEINEAYEVLKEPGKRQQYDNFGTISGHYGAHQGADFEGFDFTTTGTSSFVDIFESIFGIGGRGSSQGLQRAGKPEPGEDLHYLMNVSFLDAARGIETPIRLVHKETCLACSGRGIKVDSSAIDCPTCKGSGRIFRQTGFMKFASTCPTCNGRGLLPGENCPTCYGEGRVDAVTRIQVKIPAGVDHNSRVRINGRGNTGRLGGPPGDLIITIQVSPHKFFNRNGANLELLLPVTYLEAALGARVEVPTLDGTTLVKIPPSTPSGHRLRIKARGIVDPRSRVPGDMIIEIKIIPPPVKDIEVRQMLKKIEEKAPYFPRAEFEP